MTRTEFQELAELYVLGVLEPAEKAECDGYLLLEPEEARQGLKRAIVNNSRILAAVPDLAPPDRLRGKVVASLTGRPVRNIWGWALAAVAASLVAATVWLGQQNSVQRNELAEARRLLEQQSADARRSAEVLAMIGAPGTRSVSPAQGRASYFLNPQRGVVLIAGSLNPLQPGRAYAMWIIPKRGAPVAAGLFKPDAQGNAIHTFGTQLDLGATGALAVTDEPEAGSGAPTTTPFLVAPVAGL